MLDPNRPIAPYQSQHHYLIGGGGGSPHSIPSHITLETLKGKMFLVTLQPGTEMPSFVNLRKTT